LLPGSSGETETNPAAKKSLPEYFDILAGKICLRAKIRN
jgi:hypothetical protein